MMDLALYSPADNLVARTREAWRPPPRRSMSEWAEAKFYLSAESAAEPGRWKTIPYQRGILDAFTDPAITHVWVMKSARVGWTKCLDIATGYYVDQDPCPIMIVQPTLEDAHGFSKEELAPMFRDCPDLAALATTNAKDSDNTILHKQGAWWSVSIVGANSPRGFRRVSRKVVLFDEVDGYPQSAGAEGDPISLGIRRTEYYWDRKIGGGSTPTIGGRSRIEAAFLQGDQRRYYVPCPHCSTMQVLVFKSETGGFRWPGGRPDLAVYVCTTCGAEIQHHHKRDMVEAGEWRPGPHAQFPNVDPPPPFNGHASFHIWAAYSYSPNATWGQLCSEFVEANRQGPEMLKTFVNTALGEAWQERGEAPEWKRLYERREPYAIGTCPAGVRFLTAGVDVQKDRLVYEVVGWGREKRSWSIDAGVLPGDTSDAGPNGPWLKLDALLDRRYPHAGGADLPILMMAVDSGAITQEVYRWCRQKPMSRVIAVKGVEHMRTLVGVPSPVDVTLSGKRIRRGYKVWSIGSSVAKSELYGWLSLTAPTDEEVANGAELPPGYCTFPEHGEDYFKQLTGEQLISMKNKRGYTTFVWAVIPGRENHYLDSRNYARAASAVVGLDRFRESDWQSLEKALGHVEPPKPPKPVTPTQAGATSVQPESPKPATKKPSWLGNRGNNWLKGRR